MEHADINNILKAATRLKKTVSEDAAIEFIISIIEEGSHLEYDLVPLLKRISTYFKKSSTESRVRIISLFTQLAETSDNSYAPIKSEVYEEFAMILNCT